jgi:hypothetical protein
MAEFIITPNGNLVNIAGGKTPVLQGSQVIYGDVIENFDTPAAAKEYYDNFIVQAKANGLAADLRTGLTWISITPNTATVGVAFDASVTGTGFTVSGAEYIKLDDGTGHIAYGDECLRTSDSNINAGFDLPAASTYTLYYSLDGGATWTTTGLTVTAS